MVSRARASSSQPQPALRTACVFGLFALFGWGFILWDYDPEGASIVLQPQQVEDLLSAYDLPAETPAEIPSLDTAEAAAEIPAIDTAESTPIEKPVVDHVAPVKLDSASLHLRLRLQADSAGWVQLNRFFERLVELERRPESDPIHVLHYGDSQLEGDRITGPLRNLWQKRWGGFGPGMHAAVPLVPSMGLRQGHSEEWVRHTFYGRRDTSLGHKDYGLLATFAQLDSGFTSGQLTFSPHPSSYRLNRQWERIRLWHGPAADSCRMEIWLDDSLRALHVWSKGDPAAALNWPIEQGALRMDFNGIPPRLHAVEFAGPGIQMHNIPMRGSSGTLFRKLERAPLVAQWKELNPALVVLQYGGNTVPYCRDSIGAQRYGGWFASQIRLFKSRLPGTAIIAIGPSDMARKTGPNYASYPMVGEIRDAMREVCLKEGIAFWDLLDVMGGEGSMPGWVATTPPLAGADHVHFTSRGSKKVATLFDRSIMHAFDQWKIELPNAPD